MDGGVVEDAEVEGVKVGVAHVEASEWFEACDFFEEVVGDECAIERKGFEIREGLDFLEESVGHVFAAEVEFDDLAFFVSVKACVVAPAVVWVGGGGLGFAGRGEGVLGCGNAGHELA